jgi:hypothetical protein
MISVHLEILFMCISKKVCHYLYTNNTILLIKRKDESKMLDENDEAMSPKAKCIIKLLYAYPNPSHTLKSMDNRIRAVQMRSKSIEVEGARMLPSKVNHAIN